MKNGGLKHRETYYVTVIAVNKVGLKTTSYSKEVVVDDTPPIVRIFVSPVTWAEIRPGPDS